MEKILIDYTGMLVIYDTLFEINSSKGTLKKYGTDLAEFPIKNLLEKDGFLFGRFAKIEGQISAVQPLSKANEGNYASFHLPCELKLGYKLSEEDILAFNAASHKQRLGAIIVDQDLSNRLNGIPSVCNVLNKSMELDFSGREMKDVKTGERIKFPLNAAFEYSLICYNHKTNTQVFFDPKIKSVPIEISCYKFPPLSHFDPVGWLKFNNYPLTWTACKFPWDGRFAKVQKIDFPLMEKTMDIKTLLNIQPDHKARPSKRIGYRKSS